MNSTLKENCKCLILYISYECKLFLICFIWSEYKITYLPNQRSSSGSQINLLQNGTTSEIAAAIRLLFNWVCGSRMSSSGFIWGYFKGQFGDLTEDMMGSTTTTSFSSLVLGSVHISQGHNMQGCFSGLCSTFLLKCPFTIWVKCSMWRRHNYTFRDIRNDHQVNIQNIQTIVSQTLAQNPTLSDPTWPHSIGEWDGMGHWWQDALVSGCSLQLRTYFQLVLYFFSNIDDVTVKLFRHFPHYLLNLNLNRRS